MDARYPRIILLAMALCVGIVACQLPGATASVPCKVTITSQAASQLIQRIASQAGARGNSITITATNDEVSSLLGQYLVQLKADNPNDLIPLSNPIACFADGKLTLYGAVQWGANNNVDGIITLGAAAVGGVPVFKVEQIQLGPVSVPPELSDELSKLINRAISQYVILFTIS